MDLVSRKKVQQLLLNPCSCEESQFMPIGIFNADFHHLYVYSPREKNPPKRYLYLLGECPLCGGAQTYKLEIKAPFGTRVIVEAVLQLSEYTRHRKLAQQLIFSLVPPEYGFLKEAANDQLRKFVAAKELQFA